jgi:Lrp/AsnC family transcriptional regulator, leucine-responsive regulatory protein
MPAAELDPTDRRILRVLQEDGAIRNDALAERVNLSPAPTLRRVRALQASGVIMRYAALLDPERIGLGLRVRVDIRLDSQTRDAIDAFSAAVSARPEVLDCMVVFGDWDFLLTVVARDVEDYQRFVFDTLSKLPGVARYSSALIMRVVKHTTVLPV